MIKFKDFWESSGSEKYQANVHCLWGDLLESGSSASDPKAEPVDSNIVAAFVLFP
jgi:hypothetical protein